MKHLFLVTSAINTRFGRWSAEERLMQTIRTLKSVRERIPDAVIYLIESSSVKIDHDISLTLLDHCDRVIDFGGNETVVELYESTDNWDIIKNLTELMVFSRALQMLEEHNMIEGIDRIHKLSGRYELNDFFNPNFYETTDKIIFATKVESYIGSMGIDPTVPFYYVSRLWSWPIKDHALVNEFYAKAINEFTDANKIGDYLDIEHLLYKLIPKSHVLEVPKIGVEGLVGFHAHYRKD